MSNRISLWVRAADGSVFERLVDGQAFVIGRSAGADLAVADRALSRLHARLFVDGDAWMVEDLGSRNGTYVDQVRVVAPVQVRPGSEVTVGGTSLKVLSDEDDGDGDAVTAEGERTGRHTILRPLAELVEPVAVEDGDPVALASSRDRLAERLRVLIGVQRALASSIEQDELLELVLDRAFDLLRPEEGAIFLRAADGSIRLAAGRSTSGGDPAALHSRSLLREVVDRGQAALVLDTETDLRFQEAVSLMSVGLRCLVAAPLPVEDEVIGMIVLGSRMVVRQFTEDDLELLGSLAAVAALRIHNLSLANEAAERRRLEREVQLARQIQETLLPDALPQPSGWEVFARNHPSRGVSGDFYTVVERGAQLDLLVADVSGKGVGAALLTASLEALAASALDRGSAPDEACASVSRLLGARTERSKFATAFLGALDPATGRMVATNAGHNPPLIVRVSGQVESIAATGVPLGLFPGAEYTTTAVTLDVGDLLAVYTDGITEARNGSGEEYGVDRLERALREARGLALADIVQLLEADLERFVDGEPFDDDRTMLLVRRTTAR